jgi:AAA+ ATPase superfamily predicted ATPase
MAMDHQHRKLNNPFVYQGYESPDYFCDRLEETRQLISHLKNGRNVTLISPRRLGKTGLIKNTFYRLEEENKDVVCLYLDIYSTKTLRDFVEQLGSLVINDLVHKDASFWSKAMTFFGSLRPVLSVDPLTGEPSASITVEPSQEDITMRGIFQHLNESKHEVYIAIDEFQQIAEYPEKGTEALLRSYIQFAQHIHFIFSGSKFHMMAEMFSSPKRPFYQSTESMSLKPLDRDIYYDFCQRFFQEKGGRISREVFNEVYDRFDGYTSYVQNIMNHLYEDYLTVDSQEQVKAAIQRILVGREVQYESTSQFLTANQFDLLKAIARNSIVAQPTSGKFIKDNLLPGASSVRAALNVLVDKELVCRQPDGYVVNDKFMDLWLRR